MPKHQSHRTAPKQTHKSHSMQVQLTWRTRLVNGWQIPLLLQYTVWLRWPLADSDAGHTANVNALNECWRKISTIYIKAIFAFETPTRQKTAKSKGAFRQITVFPYCEERLAFRCSGSDQTSTCTTYINTVKTARLKKTKTKKHSTYKNPIM